MDLRNGAKGNTNDKKLVSGSSVSAQDPLASHRLVSFPLTLPTDSHSIVALFLLFQRRKAMFSAAARLAAARVAPRAIRCAALRPTPTVFTLRHFASPPVSSAPNEECKSLN